MESNIFFCGCNIKFFNVKTVLIKELVYIYVYVFCGDQCCMLNICDCLFFIFIRYQPINLLLPQNL